MSRIPHSQNLAKIRSYAMRGGEEAAVVAAILDKIRVLALVAGDEASNAIVVTCTLTDLDGTPIRAVNNILVRSFGTQGNITISGTTTGTIQSGSGTTTVWAKTNSEGVLTISVANTGATPNLVVFSLDDALTESIELVFA